MTGTILPRRFMTPFTNVGIRGTGVTGLNRMISRTCKIGKQYASSPRWKFRYFPPAASTLPLFDDAVTFAAIPLTLGRINFLSYLLEV
jgi:hypothetical protein